jgi:hypothetical protein
VFHKSIANPLAHHSPVVVVVVFVDVVDVETVVCCVDGTRKTDKVTGLKFVSSSWTGLKVRSVDFHRFVIG